MLSGKNIDSRISSLRGERVCVVKARLKRYWEYLLFDK